jgi:hypothetical protein
MMVIYSPDTLENKPSRKPLGFVVVNPTLIFSAMVDRHDPMKSYLIIEEGRKLTPISEIQTNTMNPATLDNLKVTSSWNE